MKLDDLACKELAQSFTEPTGSEPIDLYNNIPLWGAFWGVHISAANVML